MFSPYQLALLIRSLDSRLVSIQHKQTGNGGFLIYKFAVAGKVQAFSVALDTEAVESIVDLYPAAWAFETQLQKQLGLVFRPQHKHAPMSPSQR